MLTWVRQASGNMYVTGTVDHLRSASSMIGFTPRYFTALGASLCAVVQAQTSIGYCLARYVIQVMNAPR